MKSETPESELLRLCKEQTEIRQAEIFGGLSAAERTTYDAKAERIHALESEIQAKAVGKKRSQSAKAEQRLQWNRPSETDTHQNEPHKPYQNREKDSTDASTDSTRQRRKGNNEPDKPPQV